MNTHILFDDMGGRFEARLRDHRTVVRSTKTREGEISLSNSIAVLEARFDFKVLDRLHQPSFVGIERVTSEGSRIYLIYEIVNLKPTHFQMLGMDVSLPKTVRLEFLTRINDSWGESEETWLDIVAVPTGYSLELDGNEPRFAKTTLIPLIGSRAYLLSNYTVRRFLCVDEGVPIGTLIGFDMPLTVDIGSIIRYHAGVFGFTGSGKSNLTSYLIRKAVEAIPDLKVLVFDVAGEYPIHLLDLVTTYGVVFSTEDFQGDVSNFLNAQAMPETLEERLPKPVLEERVKRLFEEGRVQKIVAEDSGELRLDLNFILATLKNIYDSGKAGATSANLKLREIVKYLIEGKGYDRNTDLAEIMDEDREYLIQTLEELVGSAPDRSSLKIDLSAILNHLKELDKLKGSEDFELRVSTPSILANQLLRSEQPTLSILYLPDPDKARLVAARLINTLLYVKKTRGTRRKVLVVLDEAQEFIPDRALKSDYSDESNRAVEALLRQGRKYRAHCWLSTQRVAHLNVNALQQLHSYFVSTLPRLYDRIVIADAFSLSYDLLEKTTELDTGQWLFVSYKATKQKSVPAFIQSPNNEDILLTNLGIK